MQQDMTSYAKVLLALMIASAGLADSLHAHEPFDCTPLLIAGLQADGADLTLSGGGGPQNWPYYVVMTTNLPATIWTPVATNQFDGCGGFSLIIRNAVTPFPARMFYRIQLQLGAGSTDGVC